MDIGKIITLFLTLQKYYKGRKNWNAFLSEKERTRA